MMKYFTLLIVSLFFVSCQADYKLDIINKNLKKDSTDNMILIPEGKAIIGSNEWEEKGYPEKVVTLKAFYIDKYEVSNMDYNTCFKAGICRKPEYYGMKELNNPMQPVVGVSFDDAQTFCKWLGKRLPTEEEWEKAARGPKGYKYPWGNDKLECQKAVYGRAWGKDCIKNNKFKYTENVDSLEKYKSYYGVYNMVGNVWEWVDTEYLPKYFNKPKESKAEYKTIKGGSFGSTAKYIVTYSRRWERPYQRTVGTGFRCVKDVK